MNLTCVRQLQHKFRGHSMLGIFFIGCFALVGYLFVHLDNLTERQNGSGLIDTALISDEDKVELGIEFGHIIQNRTRILEPPAGTQMALQQIEKILSVLPRNGNLLVWGLGNDSPYWHNSTYGKVVFIEEFGTSWFDKITKKYPFLNACKVKYSTSLAQSLERYSNNRHLWSELDVRDQLPSDLIDTSWDVIIVDAPSGFRMGNPGRFQSIYTSAVLANIGTHIFVDDYERKVEHDMSNQILGAPIETTGRPLKKSVNGNIQAHFIVTVEVKRNFLEV